METLFDNHDLTQHSGGRAGLHEFGWAQAGYKLDDVEAIRQELLSQNGVGRVQKALQKLGIRANRLLIYAVKSYNFYCQGIGFLYENYAAWRRLATGKGVIGDAAYLVHEIAEVEEWQRVQRETGFKFMKSRFRTPTKLRQWEKDFLYYYTQTHSKGLEAEYKFIAQQVSYVTNGRIKISFLKAAAIDPTRQKEAPQHLLIDGDPMEKHHHFPAWKRQANKMIRLSKSTQKKLGYYLSKTTLQHLIRLIKHIPIE